MVEVTVATAELITTLVFSTTMAVVKLRRVVLVILVEMLSDVVDTVTPKMPLTRLVETTTIVSMVLV